jgi:hypothetical protein
LIACPPQGQTGVKNIKQIRLVQPSPVRCAPDLISLNRHEAAAIIRGRVIPHGFARQPQSHLGSPLMFLRKTMKTVFGKINRSEFYYFIISNLPVKRVTEMETGFDFLGEMMVISLLAGVVFFMRFLLGS